MSTEEFRNIYLGKTPTCVNLYLGNASGKLAKFFYDKAGIEFELYKTDLLASKDDFLYLMNASATTFKETADLVEVTRSVRVLLDANDIMNQYGFANAHTFKNKKIYKESHQNTGYDGETVLVTYRVTAGEKGFSPTSIYHGCDLILHNKTENVAIFVNTDELPPYDDTVLTCCDWNIAAPYTPSTLDQLTVTGEPVRDILCRLFHRSKYEYDVLDKKLRGFKDVYCDKKDA